MATNTDLTSLKSSILSSIDNLKKFLDDSKNSPVEPQVVEQYKQLHLNLHEQLIQYITQKIALYQKSQNDLSAATATIEQLQSKLSNLEQTKSSQVQQMTQQLEQVKQQMLAAQTQSSFMNDALNLYKKVADAFPA